VTIDPADATAYITGEFTTVGGEPRAGAAAVGADGSATGWDPSPGENYPNTAIVERPPGGVLLLDDRVLLTGPFTLIGSRRQPGFAFFGPAGPPLPVSPPKVTGTAKVGESPLSCVAAVWAGDRGTLTIAWLRDDAEILGQTGRTYTVVAADRGHVLRCRETMSNAASSVAQVSDPTATVTGLAPALESPPAVGGQASVGGSAQCTTGLWRNSPSEYRYRWLLDDAAIDGASEPSYTVTAAQLGHALGCEVTASNADGSSPAARSENVKVTDAPPAALGIPLISGDARVAGNLTCVPGPWERARVRLISVTVVPATARRKTTLARGSRSVKRATAATVRLILPATTRRLVAAAGRRGVRVIVSASFKPARKGSATTAARRSATLIRPPATRRTRAAGA
jgi:hypothetical protein